MDCATTSGRKMSGRNFTSKWVSSQYYLFICILYLLYTNTYTTWHPAPKRCFIFLLDFICREKKTCARKCFRIRLLFRRGNKAKYTYSCFYLTFYIYLYIGIYRGIFFYLKQCARSSAHTINIFLYSWKKTLCRKVCSHFLGMMAGWLALLSQPFPACFYLW